MLLYEGELTVAVVKQARQGPLHSTNSPAGNAKPRVQVSSIDAGGTSLKCVVLDPQLIPEDPGVGAPASGAE